MLAGVPTASRADTPSGCEDVLFIGLRGSGQTEADAGGFGPQVAAALDTFARRMNSAGLSLEAVPGSYPSLGVEVLVGDLTIRAGDSEYFDGVDEGVRETLRLIRRSRSVCADQQEIVSAGFSQGALVVHNVTLELGTNGRSAIDSILLLADPRRVGGSRVDRGRAPGDRSGVYQLIAPVRPDIPRDLRERTRGYCIAGDIVCDYTLGNLGSTSIHTDR